MNFRQRLEKSRRERQDNVSLAPANDNEQNGVFNSDFFGIENVRNLPACLDLRFADGTCKAFPYCYVTEINFEASEGIEIITSDKTIKIIGRDLVQLYHYLTLFRVRYIQANIGTDTMEAGLFVGEIIIE